jgi:hypothetical protein
MKTILAVLCCLTTTAATARTLDPRWMCPREIESYQQCLKDNPTFPYLCSKPKPPCGDPKK